MIVTIDGIGVDVPAGSSLGDILSSRGEPLDHVLVELNGRLVRSADLAAKILSEGDVIEVILPAIGG